jgi:ribosome-binding factor A
MPLAAPAARRENCATSTVLAARLRDPALQDVHHRDPVRVSPDLRNATAYVMPLGGARAADALPALRRAAPFLRGQVARAVDLRLVPQLDFAIDTSFDHAQRIDGLLRRPEVARDLEADAGRDPDADDEAR